MATSEAVAPLDYTSRGSTLVFICVLGTVTTGILVPLRLFVRARIVKSIGWDDWTLLVAAAFAIAGNVTTMLSVRYGAGRHIQVISPQDFIVAMKYNFVCQLISIYCLLFLKLSICLFIARLGPRPIYKRICYGTAIILSLYTVACGFTIIFQCTPVEKIWDRTGVEGTCLSRASLLGLSYAHTAVSVFVDFLLVAVPVPIIWNVQLPIRQKVVLNIVLALGLFAAAASCVKFNFVVNYGKQGDFLWDIVDVVLWTMIEIMVGIICICIPALRPLFKQYFHSRASTDGHGVNQVRPDGLKIPSGPHGHSSKATVYSGARRIAKDAHESEESIFAKSDIELGIHVTQELEVRISENRSVSSMDEGTTGYKGQVLS